MKIRVSRKFTRMICVALLILISTFSITLVGSVQAASTIQVTIDPGKTIGTNDYTVGVKLDYEWKRWRDSSTLRQLAQDAGFKLVAFYTWKSNSPRACTYWSESTKTGTFDWQEVDSLVQRILEIGAVPLLSLGGYDMSSQYLPRGMAINSRTRLPYPDSWAAYCKEWVRHFKAVGLPVKYYQITTEPFFYFGWSADLTKLGHYVELWNAAARAMRAVDPTILLSHDFITAPRVLDYWVKYGDDIDFLDFHKYDSYSLSSWSSGYRTDSELLSLAETRCHETSYSFYGVDEARQIWFNARGKRLPVINSEFNLNSAWQDGTDPRIQKMVGAVWTALVLRTSILKGLDSSAYFQFGSYASWTRTGNGFGLINLDNNRPWYPYYVHEWVGNNLQVGNPLVGSTSSSSDVRPLAWINNGKLNVLLICKVDQSRSLSISGIQGQIKYYKIDDTISYLNSRVQTGTISAGTPVYLNGYTVMLLQSDTSTSSPTPPPTPPSSSTIFADDFESGDFSRWTGTTSTSGETATVASYRPYSGSFNARFASNGGSGFEYAYCYTAVDEQELYARGYFSVIRGLPLADDSDQFFFLRFRGNDQSLVGAGIRRDGYVDSWILYARDQTGWAVRVDSVSQSVESGRWYCIELHWKQDAFQGLAEMYVDGEKVLDLTGIDTAYFGEADTINFGLVAASNVQNDLIVYGDCFAASTTYVGPKTALLLADDFESGDFSRWTGTTSTSGETATVASYRPYSGDYHGRFASDGGSGVEYAYSYKTVDEETVYARGYFNIVRGLPLSETEDRFYFLRLQAGSQSLAGVGIRRQNGVEKWMVYGRDGSGWVWPTYVTSPSIEMDRWYCIELCWQKDDADGRIEVFIDGQKIFEIAGVDTSYYGNVDSVHFGLITATGVQNDLIVYGDSFAIAKTYIGP